MIDMGLLPPEGSGQEQERVDHNNNNNRPSTDDDEELDRGAAGEGDADEGEPPEAIGLIGHFEAAHLAAQKGQEGRFTGSLDMSMTERDLMSTEEGIGEHKPREERPPCQFYSHRRFAATNVADGTAVL